MQLTTKRKIFDITSKTLIMGILNVTPDSFSDGGKFFNISSAVNHARQMGEDGADIIDIGGESTASYTGAERISQQVELQRVIPVITAVRKEMPDITISIDTYKSAVAKEAMKHGADIINDPSGLQLDGEMVQVIAQTRAVVIINHMQGNPETMLTKTIQHRDVMQDLGNFFTQQITLLEQSGVSREKIILDPGFGFRKTVAQNIEMIQRLHELKNLGVPILIGISRKSTIGKLLQEALGEEFPPTERMEGSLAATAIAVLHGANIVRTHDVRETKQFLAVLDAMHY